MSMTKKRFSELWRQCPKNGKAIDPLSIYEQLFSLYSEPQRRYHTPNHLRHCFGQVDLAVHLMDDPIAVELALWFHDAIYDAKASDNEWQSAELFSTSVKDALNSNFSQKVYELILITKHQELPQVIDEKFIVDIDLSSFGLPWDDFKRDSRAVRQEFTHLTDEEFFNGQIKFLRSLLDRSRFYATDFFYERYEVTARKNLERYLTDLQVEGY